MYTIILLCLFFLPSWRDPETKADAQTAFFQKNINKNKNNAIKIVEYLYNVSRKGALEDNAIGHPDKSKKNYALNTVIQRQWTKEQRQRFREGISWMYRCVHTLDSDQDVKKDDAKKKKINYCLYDFPWPTSENKREEEEAKTPKPGLFESDQWIRWIYDSNDEDQKKKGQNDSKKNDGINKDAALQGITKEILDSIFGSREQMQEQSDVLKKKWSIAFLSSLRGFVVQEQKRQEAQRKKEEEARQKAAEEKARIEKEKEDERIYNLPENVKKRELADAKRAEKEAAEKKARKEAADNIAAQQKKQEEDKAILAKKNISLAAKKAAQEAVAVSKQKDEAFKKAQSEEESASNQWKEYKDLADTFNKKVVQYQNELKKSQEKLTIAQKTQKSSADALKKAQENLEKMQNNFAQNAQKTKEVGHQLKEDLDSANKAVKEAEKNVQTAQNAVQSAKQKKMEADQDLQATNSAIEETNKALEDAQTQLKNTQTKMQAAEKTLKEKSALAQSALQ